MTNILPIRFDGIIINRDEPLWKQILWVSVYQWDESPYGLTIRVLGFDIEFLLGRWK